MKEEEKDLALKEGNEAFPIPPFQSKERIREWMQNSVKPFRELMAYYQCAMMETETKFKVLSQEFSLEYDRNPIESIKTRLKSLDSIVNKLEARGFALSVESIEKNLNDVAGVRVICGFPSDIYMISEAFLNQDDVRLVTVKDYMKNPKPNGYRSLHLIVEIPIFLREEKKMMKVEVQFRTISMDWWASLEHKIRYKKSFLFSSDLEEELKRCADQAEQLDRRMEDIRNQVYGESKPLRKDFSTEKKN